MTSQQHQLADDETGIEADDSMDGLNEELPNGTLLLGDQFTITRRLGKGGFGITYLAQDNYLERSVVIKECFPEVFCERNGTSVLVRSQMNREKYRSIVDMFMREARSMAKLRHPNIIGVHRVFEDNDTAYMALDLIDGQDMRQVIDDKKQSLTPQQIKEILIKLLDAVELVHDADLLHRDISPDNILLDKWASPALIDFGAAREEASRGNRELSALLVVKDGYSPQEFYFSGSKQTPCSDLYALGATFYHLITGEAPANSQTRMAEVAAGNPDPCAPLAGQVEGYEPKFLEAIDKAMNVLPKERIQTAREWSEIINPKEQRPPPMLRSVDKQLEKTLTRLVTETNKHVMTPEKPKEQPAEVNATQPKKAVPDWVAEFNAETEGGTVPDRKRSARPMPKAAPAPLKLETPKAALTKDKPLVLGASTPTEPDRTVTSEDINQALENAAGKNAAPKPLALTQTVQPARTGLKQRLGRFRGRWKG